MTPEERELLLTLSWVVKSQMQCIGIDQPLSRENADTAAGILETKTQAVLVAGLTAPAPLTPRPKYVSIEHAPDPQDIAARWRANCCRNGAWGVPSQEERYYQLVALGDAPERSAVEAILGVSWTRLSCDGCDNYELSAVRIDGPYGDGHRYCPTCIREAAAILDTME